MITKRKRTCKSLLIALLLSLMMPFSTWAGDMAVHFIDVGQGLAVLAQSGGQNLLYDGGSRSHSDELISYLQQQNVDTIDYMISSHYDEDHLGGLVECLNQFSVSEILGSDYVHTSELFNQFMNTATANALIVQYPEVGDTYTFGTGEFTVLAPSGINPDDSNNNSVVIKLTNGSNSFLLTGDAEETSEQDMISTGRDLDCNVLCLGHHGSASSTSWDLLEATTPEYAVISCGADNSYGHPAAETMQKLQDMEIPVYRTDKQGSIIVQSDGESLTWNLSPCNDYNSGDQQSAQISDAGVLENTESAPQQQTGALVWIPATGQKYHSIPDCGNMNPDKATQLTESEAIQKGYGKCSKCF